MLILLASILYCDAYKLPQYRVASNKIYSLSKHLVGRLNLLRGGFYSENKLRYATMSVAHRTQEVVPKVKAELYFKQNTQFDSLINLYIDALNQYASIESAFH
jgi:hypothetical protein